MARTCENSEKKDHNDTTGLTHAPKDTFTVAALPDTQDYTFMFPDVYARMTRWIVDNKKKQNIVFVSHLGDMVDKADERGQWRVARAAMRELDGHLPYGVALGNHDFMAGRRTMYEEYFPPALFNGKPWYTGRFAHSSYQLISTHGLALLFLHLECNAGDEALEWADQVIAQHSDRRVVVSTHCYLGGLTNSRLPREERWYTPRGRPLSSHFADGNSAQELWEKCFCKHRNVFMIMSGHYAYVQAFHRTSHGLHGNPVHEIVADYSFASRDLKGAHPDFFRECNRPPGRILQESDYRRTVLARAEFGNPREGDIREITKKSGRPEHSPDGYIRLLRFVPRENRIEIRTCSPVTGRLCLGHPVVPEPNRHRFNLEYVMAHTRGQET